MLYTFLLKSSVLHLNKKKNKFVLLIVYNLKHGRMNMIWVLILCYLWFFYVLLECKVVKFKIRYSNLQIFIKSSKLNICPKIWASPCHAHDCYGVPFFPLKFDVRSIVVWFFVYEIWAHRHMRLIQLNFILLDSC